MTPIDFFWAAVRSRPGADAAIEVAADGRVLHRVDYAALAAPSAAHGVLPGQTVLLDLLEHPDDTDRPDRDLQELS